MTEFLNNCEPVAEFRTGIEIVEPELIKRQEPFEIGELCKHS